MKIKKRKLTKAMLLSLIRALNANFESHVHQNDDGVEYWLARDLQQLLGYEKWDNFMRVIEKAKISCDISGQSMSNHFADVGKKVFIGSNAETEVSDMILTRYACYLVAQNGDSRKEQIAFAQTYFAMQTRKLELIEKRIAESERLSARKKLAETEKELSSVILEFTGSVQHFGLIRSKGDQALFSHSTEEMKSKWCVPKARALADFAPTIILKAKDFATEITIFNTRQKKIKQERQISQEHVTNNKTVRKTLLERGIRPESLPASEDIKKLERRVELEQRKDFRTSLAPVLYNKAT